MAPNVPDAPPHLSDTPARPQQPPPSPCDRSLRDGIATAAATGLLLHQKQQTPAAAVPASHLERSCADSPAPTAPGLLLPRSTAPPPRAAALLSTPPAPAWTT